MRATYCTVPKMIRLIDEPNRSACLKILEDNLKLFQTVQGSTNNHQNWLGGYFDHVQEVMNIAIIQYKLLSSLRTLPFSLSDLLLVVYLHDIEKPWKYELVEGQLQHKSSMKNKEDHQRFRMLKLAEYGIVFTPEQENGMKYAEGELNDYSNRRRVMGPLACLAHVCDVLSARLWFDHPEVKGDQWEGAMRNRD
jgi:hypothetical protein